MTIKSSKLKDYILYNSSFAKDNTIDIVINELVNELRNNGFDLDNLDVVSGETSINFIGDNIVIRLTYVRYDSFGYKSISDYISHSSAILQPLFEKKINTGDINYPTILGLKKLQIGTISENERNNTYIRLRNDGYLFNDAKKLDNFGKDEFGNVYLIDYGELIYINDQKKLNNSELFYKIQYQKFIERELKYHIGNCKDLNDLYLEYLKNIQLNSDEYTDSSGKSK